MQQISTQDEVEPGNETLPFRQWSYSKSRTWADSSKSIENGTPGEVVRKHHMVQAGMVCTYGSCRLRMVSEGESESYS